MKIRISIPEPCQEGWNNMTPVDDQRSHCKSCNRVLTDFSQMSDTELALYFTQSKGKLCGHFAKHQLNRPLFVPAENPKKKYWLSALWLIPFAWFAKPAQAQTITGKPPVCVNDGKQQTVADTTKQQQAVPAATKISGTITDANTGKPVKNAEVTLSYRKDYNSPLEPVCKTTTDAKGNYSLPLPVQEKGKMGTWLITAAEPNYIHGYSLYKPEEQKEKYDIALRDAMDVMDGVMVIDRD
ncbi:MAG: hypothetical protein FD123_104 [Bacteroidetes bacterium]|nr:MAG: hypothetical protein FD123_104 [Bacteroidota bacterium]